MITCTLQLHAPTRDALETELIKLLQERGYFVEKPRDWETPKAFCARLGIAGPTLSRLLRDPRRPQVDLERGRSSRVTAIASNSLFEKFCRRHKPQ